MRDEDINYTRTFPHFSSPEMLKSVAQLFEVSKLVYYTVGGNNVANKQLKLYQVKYNRRHRKTQTLWHRLNFLLSGASLHGKTARNVKS